MSDYIQEKALSCVSGFQLDPSTDAAADSTSLDPIDGFVVDSFFTPSECARLVQAAESSGGFAFWDPVADAERRSVRNADTLEFEDSDFCAALWQRLAPFVPSKALFTPDDEERYEPDLEGEWVASGLNPHLLLNRYGSGGHFAPHADGSTLVDFNHRSLYTVLIYLNHCTDGGATQLLDGSDGNTSTVDAQSGARVARADAVVHTIRPELGRALVYYHQTLHAGEPVGAGCAKYCLRTDVMYERSPPICTEPKDVKAFELILEARAKEAAGEPMEALPLYMRAKKLSAGIARAYRLS